MSKTTEKDPREQYVDGDLTEAELEQQLESELAEDGDCEIGANRTTDSTEFGLIERTALRIVSPLDTLLVMLLRVTRDEKESWVSVDSDARRVKVFAADSDAKTQSAVIEGTARVQFGWHVLTMVWPAAIAAAIAVSLPPSSGAPPGTVAASLAYLGVGMIVLSCAAVLAPKPVVHKTVPGVGEYVADRD